MGSNIIILVCLFCLACCVFYNSLPNGFAFDDHLAIVNNGDTDPETPWSELWRNDIWGKNLRAIDSHRSYRPLLVAIFKILRHSYGLNATAFRYFSILCHGLVSMLVFYISMEIIGSRDLAVVAAALFAAHPVHVEVPSVASVVNMAEPVSAILCLVAFLLYRADVKAPAELRANELSKLSTAASIATKLLWFLLVVIAALVKETGITAAGVLVAESLIVLAVVLASANNSTEAMYSFNKWLRDRILWFFIAFGVIFLYAALRMAIVRVDLLEIIAALFTLFREPSAGSLSRLIELWGSGTDSANSLYLGSSELIRKAENPYAFLSGIERVLSLLHLHFRYVYLLFIPIELSAEYAFDCIPKVSMIKDARNIYSFALYISAIFSLGFELFRNLAVASNQSTKTVKFDDDNKNHKSDALMLSISWFIVTFIPVSGVFLTLGTLLAERLLYMPSIGFCMMAAVYLNRIIYVLLQLLGVVVTQRTNRRVLSIVTALIVSLYAHRTILRNYDWSSDETLHLSSYSVCPRSAKLNLQNEWHEHEWSSLAYRPSQGYRSEFCDIDLQYAMLELHQNKYEEGVPYLAKSLKCIFTSMQAWPLLNQIWESQIKLSRGSSHVYHKIGSILNETGLFAIGAKQFLTGASRAFDESNYMRSIELLLHAEDSITRLSSELKSKIGNERDILEKSQQELKCHNSALGGILRSALERSKDKISMIEKKRLSTEFKRIGDMLLEAANPSCVLLDSQTGAISQLPLLALQELQVRLPSDVQQNIDSFTLLGDVFDTAVKVHDAYFNVTNDEQYVASARNLIGNAVSVWKKAGEAYFEAGMYSKSQMCFQHALRYENIFLSTVKRGSVPCDVHYWYAHSLAGQTSFLDSKESIESAIESLSRVVECQATFSIALDDIREMKFLAADQIQKLNAYLRSTFFITTTVYL